MRTLSLILSRASLLKRSPLSLDSKIVDQIGLNTHSNVKTQPYQAAVMPTQIKGHHRGQHRQRAYLKFIRQVAHYLTRAPNYKDSLQSDLFQVRGQEGHPGQLSSKSNLNQLA